MSTAGIHMPCWVELSSPDTTASEAFYHELLGWEHTSPGALGLGSTARVDGRAVAGISPQPAEAPASQPGFWSLYFRVADLAASMSQVEKLGGTVLMAAPGFDGSASAGIVMDPTGVAFGLLQYEDGRGIDLVGAPGAARWFELHTKDLSVLDFYTGVFGWEVGVVTAPSGADYHTLVHEGEAFGGVLDTSSLQIPAHWETYFEVADPQEIADRIDDLGGQALTRVHDTLFGRVGRFIDVHNAAFPVISWQERTEGE